MKKILFLLCFIMAVGTYSATADTKESVKQVLLENENVKKNDNHSSENNRCRTCFRYGHDKPISDCPRIHFICWSCGFYIFDFGMPPRQPDMDGPCEMPTCPRHRDI